MSYDVSRDDLKKVATIAVIVYSLMKGKRAHGISTMQRSYMCSTVSYGNTLKSWTLIGKLISMRG